MGDEPDADELLDHALNELQQAYVELDRVTELRDDYYIEMATNKTESAIEHVEAYREAEDA